MPSSTPVRELEVDRLAVRERDPLRLERRRIDERYGQPIGDVGALSAARARAGRKPPNAAAAAPAAATAEQAFEQVAEIGRVASKAALEAVERRRFAPRTRPPPPPKPPEAERHLRIALLVDLAAVVLGALVLVGQQIVGGRHLAEALGGVWIVLVAVGMKLLGEAAVRLFDLRFARAALHA